MLRFVARHTLVRLVAGRAVPVLLVWDLAVLANRTRQIPAVDRGLRRGAGAARRGLGTVVASPRWPTRPSRPRRERPLWTPERPITPVPDA
jgi:hypothetical protein